MRKGYLFFLFLAMANIPGAMAVEMHLRQLPTEGLGTELRAPFYLQARNNYVLNSFELDPCVDVFGTVLPLPSITSFALLLHEYQVGTVKVERAVVRYPVERTAEVAVGSVIVERQLNQQGKELPKRIAIPKSKTAQKDSIAYRFWQPIMLQGKELQCSYYDQQKIVRKDSEPKRKQRNSKQVEEAEVRYYPLYCTVEQNNHKVTFALSSENTPPSQEEVQQLIQKWLKPKQCDETVAFPLEKIKARNKFLAEN